MGTYQQDMAELYGDIQEEFPQLCTFRGEKSVIPISPIAGARELIDAGFRDTASFTALVSKTEFPVKPKTGEKITGPDGTVYQVLDADLHGLLSYWPCRCKGDQQ